MENSTAHETVFKYSIPVPTHKYEQEEYFCRFTPRIHIRTLISPIEARGNVKSTFLTPQGVKVLNATSITRATPWDISTRLLEISPHYAYQKPFQRDLQ